mmetsp:Transcript_2110/g.4263  ORF Transcript_2110/g.4263 Transcript_2110/m.4263 type:complete len:106 (+) Transcript_2110:288-605(+)
MLGRGSCEAAYNGRGLQHFGASPASRGTERWRSSRSLSKIERVVESLQDVSIDTIIATSPPFLVSKMVQIHSSNLPRFSEVEDSANAYKASPSLVEVEDGPSQMR